MTMKLDALEEQIADKVHANWMASKLKANVTSRKLESGEELMVPYAQLSEQAKDLDRGTVRSVIAALREHFEGQALTPAVVVALHEVGLLVSR